MRSQRSDEAHNAFVEAALLARLFGDGVQSNLPPAPGLLRTRRSGMREGGEAGPGGAEGAPRRPRTHILSILNLAVFPLWLMVAGSAFAQPAQAPDPASPIARDEIARAIETVKADPNLNAERTIRWLRWIDEAEQPEQSEWLLGLVRWIAESARVLMWVAAGLLAGLLAFWLIRVLQAGTGAAGDAGFEAPTHVRDLDIRPESLPRDIGAAARALWDRGEHRTALALLYRGLLSRLAHVHRVPIRDSTTEGDCLALAAAHLTADRHDYVRRLVRAWQQSVYAGEYAGTDTVHALCDRFGAALDRSDPSGTVALTAAGAQT